MDRTIPAFALLLILAACGQEKSPEPVASDSAAPSATTKPSATPEPSATDDGKSRFTNLTNCKLLESIPEEAGYSRSDCGGVGGFTLERSEADGRQSVAVVRSGKKDNLRLPEIAGSGFSSVGKQAEWRGEGEGEAFKPTALILRHEEQTDPEAGKVASRLVVVKLDPTPCAIAVVQPGADQNAEARRLADAGGACMKR